MRISFNNWVRCALGLMLTLVVLSYAPKPVFAASQTNQCAPYRPSKLLPVLLVHGFSGGPVDTWNPPGDPNSMQNTLSKAQGIYAKFPDDAFDYHQSDTKWVTDDSIGLALEKKIACMAKSSREAHGPGKVLVIAYSMGGLATRYAVNQLLDGHPIADDVGYIITIATPNTGSPLAILGAGLLNVLCVVGHIPLNGEIFVATRQLCSLLPAAKALGSNIVSPANQLPPIPSNIPVYAIAGNVSLPDSLFFNSYGLTGSDLVVSTSSARVEANPIANGLGGDFMVQCKGIDPIVGLSGASCDHFGMSHNPKVDSVVLSQISDYLATLTSISPCPPAAGTCLGTRTGNILGDGSDQVGVTYQPSSSTLQVHVISASGQELVKTVQPPNPSDGNIASPSFLGISDLFGNGRDEIVMRVNCGQAASPCGYVALEYSNGTLQPVPFYGQNGENGWTDSVSGFACSSSGGSAQITVAYGFQSPSYQATYQYDGKGSMQYVSSQVNPATLVDGAHCPGLAVS